MFSLSAVIQKWLSLTSVLVTIIVSLIGLKIYNIITTGKCKSKARLDGKVVLVTGGNSGIGLETARDFARRGARVIIASRNAELSSKAVADIIATTGNTEIEFRYLNLAKLSSVRKFAEDFNRSFDRLDILVNNAGTGGLKHRLTDDGIDVVTQINYFGPFLLTNLLLDKLISSKPSRIVIVSSKAHFFGKLDLDNLKCETKKPWYTIYANSKLYEVLWTKALARKLPRGVTVNAVHPGLVKTEIFQRLMPILRQIVYCYVRIFYKTPEEGAQTTVHVAVDEELSDVSGKYFVDCKISEESSMAKNEELIDKLWSKSLLITNQF